MVRATLVSGSGALPLPAVATCPCPEGFWGYVYRLTVCLFPSISHLPYVLGPAGTVVEKAHNLHWSCLRD
jgi:hypothetical protein